MFKSVTQNDLTRVEGEFLPQLAIEGELIRLGGGEWQGFDFKVYVLKATGYDVDHPPPDQVRLDAYNKIADALNVLGNSASVKSLCTRLGIPLPT